MAHLLGRFRSILLLAAVFVLVGGGAGFAQPGTPKGEWVGLFGCSNAPTYLRMHVAADGSVDLFVHNERLSYQPVDITGQSVEASLPQSGKPIVNKPTGISARLDRERDLLTGTLPGWGDPLNNCTHFVLVRMLDGPSRPDNADGLLFVPPKQLQLEQCRSYANWLLSSEPAEVRLPELRFTLSPLLLEADEMRRVLGQELRGWTDEHAKRLVALATTCRNLLGRQRDAETKELTKTVQRTQRTAGGWLLAPLGESHEKRIAVWTIAAVFTRLDAIRALGKTLAEANAGRFDPPSPPDGSRQLHGYYECEGGPVFLKLAIHADGTSGRMEFGSSMVRYYPSGILEVTPESLDADGLRINPSAWVLQPAMQGRTPITLEGRLDSSTGEFTGQVLGVQGCTSFALEPEPSQSTRAQNFDGLLFHVRSWRDHDLDADRCRTYAEWLAEQTLLEFGNVRTLSSAVTDVDGMLRVLGKAPEHFREGDSRTMNALAQICRQMLNESMDAADRTLASKVHDWAPTPLRASRTNAGGNEDWLIAEQVALVARKQRQAADAKLAMVEALPAQAQSLELADRQREQTMRNPEGWLRLLNASDRKGFEAQLLEARQGLELRIAADMAETFASAPTAYEAFDELDEMLRKHQQALRPYGASAGLDALQSAYDAAAAERAELLWPGFLDEAEATLSDKADAGYEAFGQLARFNDIGDRLQRHARPADALSQRLLKYRDRSHALALDMVRRSEGPLSEWVDQLPPSVAGREALTAFTRKTFGTDAVPAELSRLRTAVEACRGRENPLNLSRPDITQALLARQWQDVAWQGFDDMAYYQTTLERIKNQCPGVVPQGEGSADAASIVGFFTRMAQIATARAMSGEADNQEDAERAVLFGLNAIFNRPGCVVDQWNNVVGVCTTEEEFSGAQQAIMTSSAAISDVGILLADGCDGQPAVLMRNLADFAALGGSIPAGEPIAAPQDYVAAFKQR